MGKNRRYGGAKGRPRSRGNALLMFLWCAGMMLALGLTAVVAIELLRPQENRAIFRSEEIGREPEEERRFQTWAMQEGDVVMGTSGGVGSDAAVGFGAALTDPNAPAVSAKSAVVIDQVSGRVLYEKKKDERVYPASTTKIMTVLLGIEYGQLDRTVTAEGEAIGVEGSSIYLKAGEQISMEDLLYGALLRSGNDAATAIAMEVGNGLADKNENREKSSKPAAGQEDETESASAVQRFVALMNDRAKQLGAEHTQFVNPTGLHDENHYTTAYDMALMARAAMNHPAFARIAGTDHWTAQRQADRDPYFYNKNKVVHQYEGGTGVKIGYTKATGRTLVASSERNGRKLICVVMDAPDWFNDSYKLMDYVYDTYETVEVAVEGQRLEKVPVEGGSRDRIWVGVREPVTCLIRPEERNNVAFACGVTQPVTAPVKRGDIAGQLHVYVAGQYVYSVPLYFFEDVDEV